MCHGFVSQFSLGNNQYPKTIQKATNIYSNTNLMENIMRIKKREKQRDGRNNRKEQEEKTLTQQVLLRGMLPDIAI